MTTDVKQSEAELTTGQTPRATRPTLFSRVAAALAGQEQSGVRGGDATIMAQQYDPRNVGLFPVGVGTLSTVMGTIECWYSIKELRQVAPIRIWRRPSLVMATIISVAGLIVFVSIVTHLL